MLDIPRKITSSVFLIVLLFLFVCLGAKASHQSDLISHGQYLAFVSGCAQCHTPMHFDEKTNAYAPDYHYFMAGAPEGSMPPERKSTLPAIVTSPDQATYGSFGTSFAANLTPDNETGIGTWTFEDFKSVMQMKKYKSQWSHRGDGRPIMPPMSWQLYEPFSEYDLHALYAYLKSLTPVHNKVPEYIPPQSGLETH